MELVTTGGLTLQDFDHVPGLLGELLLVLLYLAAITIPLTLIHELGHAFAARRLLGSDVDVSVGDVGRMAELRLGEINVTINAFAAPYRKAGYAEFDDGGATASDILWIALAGPAASLLGALVTAGAWTLVDGGVVHTVSGTMTAMGAFFVVFNLIPFSFEEKRGGPYTRTDGRLALDALKVWRELR